jgi:hypothetical protein
MPRPESRSAFAAQRFHQKPSFGRYHSKYCIIVLLLLIEKPPFTGFIVQCGCVRSERCLIERTCIAGKIIHVRVKIISVASADLKVPGVLPPILIFVKFCPVFARQSAQVQGPEK